MLLAAVLITVLPSIYAAPQPPFYDPPRPAPNTYGEEPSYISPYSELPETVYNPELYASQNGYTQRKPKCHWVDKVSYEDKCIDYKEKICYTQNVEKCVDHEYRNCTGTIETKAERECFGVKEFICGLKERVDFDTINEEFQVQRCTIVKDRVCDTTFDIDVIERDDFQCCDVESEKCEDKEEVIDDVTCKTTVDFECSKEKRVDGYGKETVCHPNERENCYKTPRTIRREQCYPHSERYCQKFTNLHPEPVEKQNCHFEPKKVCELETRSRPRKSKKYSYSQDCKPVDREICDQTERKRVVPVCVFEVRPKCDYEPETKCIDEDKKYCYKMEVIDREEVCDDKFAVEFL